MATIEILALFGSATIQDKGRIGFQRYGVPRGGAMDLYALAEGQALLQNEPNSAALEMQFGGGTFKVHGTMTLATSGGQMEIYLDNKPIPWNSSFTVYKNQILQIKKNISGVYSYLHLPGGIASTKILESRSTHFPSGLGDVPKIGYHLRSTSKEQIRQEGLFLPPAGYYSSKTINIVHGPHSALFDKKDLKLLTQKKFQMSSSRNRMGAKIIPLGWNISAQTGKTLVSDPIVPGDIQVAADGTTAILLSDSQPTGGYPRIASVITSDLFKIAQLQPGEEFYFKLIDRIEAQMKFKQKTREMEHIAKALKPLIRDPGEVRDLLSYNFISGVTRGEADDDY